MYGLGGRDLMWSCMCMALVAETSVVMYVYGLGGRDLGGHVCVWPWWPRPHCGHVCVWPWWPRPQWSCMCMTLGDSDPGHDV